MEFISQRHPIDGERENELRKLVGQVVDDRYRITELLGTGGVGAVYEAEHLGLGRKVAIKFLDREWAQVGSVASRFTREARAASSIESDHIVSVHDAGMSDGRPYLVMELLRGEDLGRRLHRCGKLPVAETLHIVAQTLRGLADAHEARIVHRDLKPDNLLLVSRKSDRNFVKIVDFGVSKIEPREAALTQSFVTRAGTVVGTPLYMSPEQAQAVSDLDARTDIYSLGAIMFECLTGRPPHVGESYEQIMLSICMNDAPDLRVMDPGIPHEVARIVERALRRDRARRFVSARQMLVAVTTVPGYAEACRGAESGGGAAESGPGDAGGSRGAGGIAARAGVTVRVGGGVEAEAVAAKTLLAGGAAAPVVAPVPEVAAPAPGEPVRTVVLSGAAGAAPWKTELAVADTSPAVASPMGGEASGGDAPSRGALSGGAPSSEVLAAEPRRSARGVGVVVGGILALVLGAVLTMWGLSKFFTSDRASQPAERAIEREVPATAGSGAAPASSASGDAGSGAAPGKNGGPR